MSNKKWRAVLVLALPVLLGIGPCSSGPAFMERIPGGVLTGAVVGGEINDWSFVEAVGLCQLETRPGFPHSLTVNCFNDGPDLYVGCMSCAGKTWSAYVSNDPRARIKIGDKVYPVTMNRIMTREEMQAPWLNRWRKTRGDENAPPIPDSYWLFRLTSR